MSIFQLGGGCGCCQSGVVCVTCSPASIPSTLGITDANGSYTATWIAAQSAWVTPNLCSPTSTSPTANCTSGTAACASGTQSGGALYYYVILCQRRHVLVIERYWYEQACSTPAHQYAPCHCTQTGPPGYSAGGGTITCGSISWSGTMVKQSGNMADPVSGTTSFSQ
jgi:hypothetical protein